MLSKKIIEKNKLDSKITCINEVMEKVKLPVDKVDIIVSEWMGVYLVHESMLSSVIYARDKYLRKDGLGLMYPSFAYLYICPIEAKSYINNQLNYWDKFYNFDFEPMRRVYSELMKEKPIVEEITADQLVSDEKILASFNLNTISMKDLITLQSFNLNFTINRSCDLQGFAFWFDVIFHTDDKVVTLSTSPCVKQTHWKQTVVLLPHILDNDGEDDENLGYLKFSKDDKFECFAILNQSETNNRHYVIDVGISKIDKEIKKEEINEESEDDEIEDEEEHPIPCDCVNLKCILIRKTLEKYNQNEDNPDN